MRSSEIRCRCITNRYRRTTPDMNDSKFAVRVLPVLRTKAVVGYCCLARDVCYSAGFLYPDSPLIGLSLIRHPGVEPCRSL